MLCDQKVVVKGFISMCLITQITHHISHSPAG